MQAARTNADSRAIDRSEVILSIEDRVKLAELTRSLVFQFVTKAPLSSLQAISTLRSCSQKRMGFRIRVVLY